MKISNETKIGALTSIAIVLLILGFNFLKGKSFTTKSMRFYAVFDNIQGLANGNPVVINGKQIGTVLNTDGGKDMRKITVIMSINHDIIIPDNSVAIINPSLLGTTSLEISLGNSAAYYKDKDTISTKASNSVFDDALQRLDPVLYQVKNAVRSLDSLIKSINSIFDPNTKNNVKVTMENLNKTTANLAISSASLETLLNTQTGALAKTMENVTSFTGNLKNNNEKITNVMANLETTTSTLSKLELEKTLNNLDGTINQLKDIVGKMNSNSGTLGKLINDQGLYNNLNATSNKLNLLMDDIRVHPKRYVNISVFGKKDKSGPLTVPMPDTINAPYLQKPAGN